MNTYGYVGGSPLLLSDPQGLIAPALGWAICVDGGCAAAAAAANAALGSLGALAIANLPDVDTSDNAPAVDWPKKRAGKSVCNCRAQGLNCDGQRAYGYGTGIANTVSQAKAIAVKAAVSNVPQGFGNIHHVSCKCTSKQGDKIPPHKNR